MEKSDIKLALVEYRDHPPQDETFVTRVHDFTESVKEMKKWLENCRAEGGEPYSYSLLFNFIEFFLLHIKIIKGGDQPEAVADGLHDALKLSWREKSTKICVLISDGGHLGEDYSKYKQ